MKYAVAGQRLWIQAFNANGFVEDDQANITCDLVSDGGAEVAIGNPIQATGKRGAYYYVLTLAQATSHELKPILRSATAGVQVMLAPSIYTTREADILNSIGGSGSETYVFTAEDAAGNPVSGAAVYITSDAAGGVMVHGTLHTNGLGKVAFNLDPGVYYAWPSHSHVQFSAPQQITVADV